MNTLALTLTPDILTEMTSMFKSHAKIIGFCCEATHLIESAKKKCKAKNCDYFRIAKADLEQKELIT